VLNLIKRVSEKWKPFVVAIEQVQFQAAVVQELHRTTSLPVIAIKPEGDKLSRFLPLEVRYEQQKVYHTLGVTRDFESELTAFPDSTHDDMIDAFSYAWLGLARITISSLGTTNHNVSPRHKYFSGAKNGKRNRLSGYYK
jgi:predicted phage terminase large subunit-like protein